jgi:hypothetical protein
MSQRAITRPTSTRQKQQAARSPAEQDIIAALERSRGRELTEQEINLSLDQARAIGEL